MFNSLSDTLGDQFVVLNTRPDPAPNRQWTVPWNEIRFRTITLPGNRINVGTGTVEFSRHVGSTLANLRPDAVVLNGWDMHASWATLPWARRRSVPLIGWIASTETAGKHRGSVSDSIRRRFLNRCSAAIVPGFAAQQFVHRLAPDLPCYRVSNAIDEPELRALGDPPSDGAALFLGELTHRKGLDLILDAAEDILNLFPRLIIAGDGPLREQVLAHAKRLPGLEYAGYVEGTGKTRLFERSAVALLPSRRDPWLLVAAEALVARRPVVLGPGVGATPDLRPLAGDAVRLMRTASPGDLVETARQVRGQVVAPEVRNAFRPTEQAAAMADAFRSAISRKRPGGTSPLARSVR